MILADGIVGQMMEKVVLPQQRPRRTPEQIAEQCPWAVTGRARGRKPNVMTTLELDSYVMEEVNNKLQAKYREIEQNEARCEEFMTDDADYLIVAFGSMARICRKSIEEARAQGVKVGLLRPITLWPFPSEAVRELSRRVKGMLVVELNAGQMIEDVKLACDRQVPVYHFGRLGGIVPNPAEVLAAFYKDFPSSKPTEK